MWARGCNPLSYLFAGAWGRLVHVCVELYISDNMRTPGGQPNHGGVGYKVLGLILP